MPSRAILALPLILTCCLAGGSAGVSSLGQGGDFSSAGQPVADVDAMAVQSAANMNFIDLVIPDLNNPETIKSAATTNPNVVQKASEIADGGVWSAYAGIDDRSHPFCALEASAESADVEDVIEFKHVDGDNFLTIDLASNVLLVKGGDMANVKVDITFDDYPSWPFWGFNSAKIPAGGGILETWIPRDKVDFENFLQQLATSNQVTLDFGHGLKHERKIRWTGVLADARNVTAAFTDCIHNLPPMPVTRKFPPGAFNFSPGTFHWITDEMPFKALPRPTE